MKQQLLKNAESNIIVCLKAYPSTCTCSILENGLSIATPTVTLGKSIALTGACGLGTNNPSSVQGVLSSPLKYFGKPFRLFNTKGQSEVVTIDGASMSEIYTRETLKYAYAQNDFLRQLIATVTYTGTEFKQNLIARFTSTSDEGVEHIDIVFDVVEHLVKQPITIDNLDDYNPIFKSLNFDANVNWERQLELAWSEVLNDLNAGGIDVYSIMDTDALAVLQWQKLNKHYGEILVQAGRLNLGQAKYFLEEYQKNLEARTRRIDWLDKNGNAIPDERKRENRHKFVP